MNSSDAPSLRTPVEAGPLEWKAAWYALDADAAALHTRIAKARAALQTASLLMERSGLWRNAAGYQTDAALWIERALQELSYESNRKDGASPQNNEPSK